MTDAGRPTYLREALHEHFAIDRRRVPVLIASALCFIATRYACGPSSALALATGLWCGYCIAFCGVSLVGLARGPAVVLAGAALVVLVGAIAGRGVQSVLWTVHGIDPVGQAVRFAWHVVFVGALILVPAAQSMAAARRHARAEAERTRLTGRLLALQAQIEPHFLFNTLATLRSLIRRDAIVAAELLDRMTAFLRAVLPDARQTSSTIAREVDIVDAYLAIMSLRLGRRLRYSLDVAPDSSGASIPPLLLQPLVENAVKHGIEPSEAGGSIDLRTSIDGGFVVIEVRNTGEMLASPTRLDDRPAPTGLHNIRDRLAALYPGDGLLTLETELQDTTVARIRLPFVTAG